MSDESLRLLSTVKGGLRELGFTEALVQENYAFADFSNGTPRVRRIPLAAFGHLPTSFESAWLGVTNGPADAQTLLEFRALGAPQLFVLGTGSVERWKMPAAGDPIFQERFSSGRILDVMRERKDKWGRDAVGRAKSLSFEAEPLQFDFYDAGLVPAIDTIVRTKLDRLLGDALARAVAAYREHYEGSPDEAGLCRLVFRLLAAKLLADRGHPGEWADGDASQVVARVERYYYGTQPVPPAVSHPEVQRVVWNYMRQGFHLQNLSVRTLAYIYENTLVSQHARKQRSIHGTPPNIAEYMVRRLPFERLVQEDRRVLAPFAGHGVFLIAALGRLRELLDPALSDESRHNYFVRMLSGIESDAFAIEVARLSLMLADYPNPDGWQLEQNDVFAADNLQNRLYEARVVLCNPPFEDFPQSIRAQYHGLRSVNQAADIFSRVLDQPPALLGFILPHSFRDGHTFRDVRRRLVEKYGSIEITELPDRIFAHSDIKSVLVLAHEPNHGQVQLRCSTVHRDGLAQFLATGAPTHSTATSLATADAVELTRLWRSSLENLWEMLRSRPTLGSVTDIHRGIEYKLNMRHRRSELVSLHPSDGFELGLDKMHDDFEPYYAVPHAYLNTTPNVIRAGAVLKDRWRDAKVVINARRRSRGPWRLIAVPDRDGLVLYQNFIGIWPKNQWAIEVIAAVMNGFVANAFMSQHEERDNRILTLKSLPLPNLGQSEMIDVTMMVREYEQLRRALEDVASGDLIARCRQLLAHIDDIVLLAYELPAEILTDLRRNFNGAERPGLQHFHISGPENTHEYAQTQLNTRVQELFQNSVTGLDYANVDRLLRQHPNLVELVMEAVDRIIHLFPNAELRIEAISDPEYEDDEQLFLGIATSLADDEASAILQRFDDEWWVDNVPRASGLLCIDLR